MADARLISSLLDIFRTNADDKNISDTSSYLDLSPLYGCDQANQATVRQHKLGLLKPDSFAERRLLLQPPGVCIYLIMYNRFHNLVAQQLLEINENGKFSLPFAEDSPQWNNLSDERREAMLDKQDEDLFQTARLCVAILSFSSWETSSRMYADDMLFDGLGSPAASTSTFPSMTTYVC